MTILEKIIKNKIPYEKLGQNDLAIYCPFCEKRYAGNLVATFNIDLTTGNGNCSSCKKNSSWNEIAEELQINNFEEKLKNKFITKNETMKTEYKKKEIDISKFTPITIQELKEILNLTIKHDDENKIATFFGMLSAYAGDSQINISFNAPSSTGKSFIPLELSKLFPKEDLIKLGGSSPKAFFHEQGEYNKEKNERIVDLSSKILIFLDMPHNQLLAGLRPIFSHDQKEIAFKIADPHEKGGIRTKTVILKGYPAVVFCTAGLKINDQEATRFLLLSPSMEQEKIRDGVNLALEKETDFKEYENYLKHNEKRNLLIERIEAIKNEKITDIKLESKELVKERFLKDKKFMQPRDQRDIKRITSMIKSIALLNLWWRDKKGFTITASKEDINNAFDLWEKLCSSQKLNLPPYVLRLYQLVMKPLWDKKKKSNEDIGISKKEISQQYYEIYHQFMNNADFSNSILPMLESAGLITEERDPNQKQKKLFYPVEENTNSETTDNFEDSENLDIF